MREAHRKKQFQLERDFDAAFALRVPISAVPSGTAAAPETKTQRWIKVS
jgi:hypothetical protein